MIITLFEGQRSETYNSLSEAADAAKNWYSEAGGDGLHGTMRFKPMMICWKR
jgi:hypothetical protein